MNFYVFHQSLLFSHCLLRNNAVCIYVRTSKALNLVLIDWNGYLLVSWRGKNRHKRIWEKSWLTVYRNCKIIVQLFIQLTLEQHEFKLHGSIYTWGKKKMCTTVLWASQVVLIVKNPPTSVGLRDVGLIPGSEGSPGGGHGKLNYSSILAWRIQ